MSERDSGKQSAEQRRRATGNDDIARGNVGTGDQGPGDVSPDEPVTTSTGELTRGDNDPPAHPPHRRGDGGASG